MTMTKPSMGHVMFTVVTPTECDYKNPRAMCWHRCISVFSYTEPTNMPVGVNTFDNPHEAVYYVEDYMADVPSPTEAERIGKLLEEFKQDMGESYVKDFLRRCELDGLSRPPMDSGKVHYPTKYKPRDNHNTPHPYAIVEGCECVYCIRETKKRDSGLTDAEYEIAEHLIKAWNGFIDLPVQHPSDKSEFHASIHRLQYLLGVRIARRNHERYWYNEEITR